MRSRVEEIFPAIASWEKKNEQNPARNINGFRIRIALLSETMKFLPQLGIFSIDFFHGDRFRLFSSEGNFSESSYARLLEAFDVLPWVRKKENFYVQYECFIHPTDSHALASLYEPSFFFPFKERLEKQLGVSFQNRIRLVAHKLITSDAIGLHTDYTLPEEGHENFRYIFQFSRGGELNSGGGLSFWASRYTKELIKQYSYKKNSGICFEITPYSFHSVAPVDGERYTLVMYLWETGRHYNGLGHEIQELTPSV